MRKNLRLIICIGIPGAGKTTWTKNFLMKNPDFVSVNRDAYRFMLRDQPMTEPKVEQLITDLQEDTVIKALTRKLNVIVDATNLKHSYIERFCKIAEYKADVEFMVFDVPLATCIERDLKRDRTVGETVITKMYKDYKNLVDSFNFQTRTQKPVYMERFVPLERDVNLPDAVIFDIDGTIALMGRRGQFDWDKVDVDDTNDIVIEQMKFHESAGRQIILVSGRDEAAREKTVYWLDFYGITYDKLVMRPKDNFQKDTVVKKNIFNEQIKGKYNILCAYDDRLSVVQMWYDLGVFCYTVNQGLKHF